MKDGSAVSQNSAGTENFSRFLKLAFFFKLEPEDNHKALNELINRERVCKLEKRASGYQIPGA
jgi:hypothetical protein